MIRPAPCSREGKESIRNEELITPSTTYPFLCATTHSEPISAQCNGEHAHAMSLGLQPQEGTTKLSASCRVQLPMPVQWGRMRGLGSPCLLTADTRTGTLHPYSLLSLLLSSSLLFCGVSFILSLLLSLSSLPPSFLGLPTST